MQSDKKNVIVELSYKFALDIISYTEVLEEKKKYKLSNQLFNSGTSIGANVREAQNAESKSDFIHKMKIAVKESDETDFWLSLCVDSKNYPDPGDLKERNISISKILSKIISSSKK